MRVLVACEESGVVRDAFLARGHAAISCDLLGVPSAVHVVGDCRPLLDGNWDLIIAHPPCTALCVSGNRYYAHNPVAIKEAFDFFMELYNAPADRVCVENPVGRVSTLFRKPDQYIQPYQFGEDASKKTGLWLRGLPKLVGTNYIPPGPTGVWANQTPSGQNKLGPSADRARLRAKTYKGVAEAMALQWG